MTSTIHTRSGSKLLELVVEDVALREAFRHAYAAATARTLHRDVTGGPSLGEVVDAALTRPDLSALAAIAAAGADPEARSTILLQLAWGRRTAVDPLQLLSAGGRLQPAPAPQRLAIAETLLRTVADLAGDRRARAGALTMLGWVLAAQGRGTAASDAVDHALSLCPEDELAGDLQGFLDAGHLPPWCTP